jgi:Xaa-Pro aminopeptidase
MDYASRQNRVAANLRGAGVNALLVTHLPNIRYLCGFTGSAGVLVLGERASRSVFYTDGRYTEQAAEEVQGARVVITRKAALTEAAARLSRTTIRSLGFEGEHLSFGGAKRLGDSLRSKVRVKALIGLVERQRLQKDRDEVLLIRASAELATGLLPAALAVATPGSPESSVAGEMELEARRGGAEGMSFDTIVAAGPRSALPHGVASSQPIPSNGFIIIDWGVILSGYCSDLTRTVHIGPVSAAHRRMYQAVRDAQRASVEAVKPGVTAGKVDQAARKVLEKAGYERYFTHSTGHGVGLEVHEAPRLAKSSKEQLAPGMVITIEPGIYIPGEGGVRIEDMVLVTEQGQEILTSTARDLITL